MLSTRWLEELKTEWWPFKYHESRCLNEPSKYDGVRLENIGGFSLIIVFSILFASMALLFEYFQYRTKCQKQNVPKKNQTEPLPLSIIDESPRTSSVAENLDDIDRAILNINKTASHSSVGTEVESISSAVSTTCRKRSKQ